MRVLALDISKTCTGVAVDGEGGRPLASSFKGAANTPTNGRAGARFSKWLIRTIRDYDVELLAVEAPIVANSRDDDSKIYMNAKIVRVLMGLPFLAETTADLMGIQYAEYAVQTVRRTFLGHGRPPNAKRAVLERCRILGWVATNDNEGDALALWYHAKSTNDRTFRPEIGTPLFRG